MIDKEVKQYAKERKVAKKLYRQGKQQNNQKLVDKASYHFDIADGLKYKLQSQKQTNKTTNITATINSNNKTQKSVLSNNKTKFSYKKHR